METSEQPETPNVTYSVPTYSPQSPTQPTTPPPYSPQVDPPPPTYSPQPAPYSQNPPPYAPSHSLPPGSQSPVYANPPPNGLPPVYAQPPNGYYPPTTTTTTTSSQPPYAQPVIAQPPYAQPLAQPLYAVPPPPQTLPLSPLAPVIPFAMPNIPPGSTFVNYILPGPPLPPLDEKHRVRLHNFVFLGSNGVIRALELVDNHGLREVWNDGLKGAGYHMIHIHLEIGRGLLYAVTNGHVYCFEALTGKLNWTNKPSIQHGIFTSDLMTLLCTKDGSILVSASNGAVIAFNAATGQIIWQTMLDTFTGQFGAFALLEHKGILIVGNEGYVYAFLMATGQLLWKNGLSGFGFCPISLAAYAFIDPVSRFVYDILFIGTYGYVLALDIPTGTKRHHVNLNGTGFKPVALLIDPPSDSVFTATSGELRCFRGATMTEVWKSDLPGMGYSWGHSLFFSEPHIIIGMHGKVAALEKATGKMVWKTSLPGSGYHLVTVGTMPNPNVLIAATCGKLYGLNRADGKLLFEDGLKGMGYAELSVSTTVFNTDFNSTTLPHNIEMIRKQRRNNNAGAAGIIIAST